MIARPTRADLARVVARHRAILAGGLAAAAVAVSLNVVAPQPTLGEVVIRANADLPAGTALTAEDLVTGRLAPADLPDGALTRVDLAVGRLLAAPLRRGEVLTDVRLAGTALLPPDSTGLVAVPIRVADRAAVALLHPGDRIDVLAAATAAGTGPRAVAAQVVASAAVVLAVPAAADPNGDGALVVLSERPEVAARLAAAALSSRLSFTLLPRK